MRDMGTGTGIRANPQVIRIVGHDGEVTEFVGDNFSLVAGPLGQRFIFDDERKGRGGCVWSEPTPINLVCVDVTVTHPRPDFRLGGTMHADGQFSPSPTRVLAADSNNM